MEGSIIVQSQSPEIAAAVDRALPGATIRATSYGLEIGSFSCAPADARRALAAEGLNVKDVFGATVVNGFAVHQITVAVDADGRTVLQPDDGPRASASQSHETLHLFNAPRTMRGQTTMEGIE